MFNSRLYRILTLLKNVIATINILDLNYYYLNIVVIVIMVIVFIIIIISARSLTFEKSILVC